MGTQTNDPRENCPMTSSLWTTVRLLKEGHYLLYIETVLSNSAMKSKLNH